MTLKNCVTSHPHVVEAQQRFLRHLLHDRDLRGPGASEAASIPTANHEASLLACTMALEASS